MLTTLRAAFSALMLLGFYILALALIGGLGYASAWLFQDGAGTAGAKLAYLTIITAAGVLSVLWKVLRVKSQPMPGVAVSPQQAPQLWQLVTELAAVAQTRVPDVIVLVPGVNAAVSEDSKLLGLIGGKRHLYLGVPLMQAFTVAQLRSVVAHELGHYSRKHTRLGEIAYRGQLAILVTVASLRGNIVGFVLRPYAWLYRTVAAAVNRRQELEADQLSVQVAGRRTAAATLREIPVVDAAWNFYETRYIDPGWEAGYAPTAADFFGGFPQLLAARPDELARLRDEPPPSKQSRFDTHPSIAARVAAMAALPSSVDGPEWTDTRPASELVPHFGSAIEVVARTAINFGRRQQLPWAEFVAVSMLARQQHQADLVYRAAARIARSPRADLGTVLGLVEAGRLRDLAIESAVARDFRAPMLALLRLAAVRSGVAQWRPSWTSPAQLVRADGRPLDLDEIAELAVDPATLAQARARLAADGIDVASAVQVETVATARGSSIVGGLANVKVDEAPHDVLLLDTGLILRPCPKGSEGGKQRLVAWATSAPPAELAKANRFVAFEDIASATIDKRVPIRVSLRLHNGQTIRVYETWGGESLTKSSADDLREAITAFVAAPAVGA
jgi:Zn-dependent protease with chaperone function